MKLVLIQNKQNSAVGYNMIAETKQEREFLSQIRNLHFYGGADNPVLYDGIPQSSRDTETVEEISFITKEEMAIRDKEVAERESLTVQTIQAKSNLSLLGLVQTGDDTFTLPDPALRDVEVKIVRKKRSYIKKTA